MIKTIDLKEKIIKLKIKLEEKGLKKKKDQHRDGYVIQLRSFC